MKFHQNIKIILFVSIPILCILLISFLIRPVKNYIYKPQRYIEYIHPTDIRKGNYLDTVFTSTQTRSHHGIGDISQYDSKYSKDTILLPNQGMIHIWFYNNHVNHFYIDYSTNPSYWKLIPSNHKHDFPNLEEFQTIEFTHCNRSHTLIDTSMKSYEHGFANSHLFLTYPRTIQNTKYLFLFDLNTLSPIRLYHLINL